MAGAAPGHLSCRRLRPLPLKQRHHALRHPGIAGRIVLVVVLAIIFVIEIDRMTVRRGSRTGDVTLATFKIRYPVETDRQSTRLNSSHTCASRMPSSA